ncbi:MAG: ATP-binding cassette domain-containing protein, partial [Nitrospinaceae bacterium]|nr:ATP-binding cassette domain-containing protein [Nitrospinaceae bacterium]NIR56090.1 ATP-binding cassette domain-containing protein [Nitrospinaceae bacterium]NIS86538.1 ATP-binding cassette domain-containing protein [Nitrospinaceae bacterium]NIT83372.1 ATP-binding cassette domain-containing protein [Nitrospinaceae bacterium]NIU45582.1 ATP-binding cassette domain-containing protein [Nitrospinaceae bacterium]
LNTIPGLVPPATDYGEGCLFADRCAHTMDVCRTHDSKVYTVDRGHTVRCHLYEAGVTASAVQEEPKIPAPKKEMAREPLITVQGLKTWFPVRKGVFRRVAAHVKAVDHVDLDIWQGSTVALVGESGCGKTTLGESILRLNREVQGSVRFRGTEVLNLPTPELKQIRRHLQIVFQDPFGSLSPRMRVRDIVIEGLQVHFPQLTPQETEDKISKVMREVGLGSSVINRYPHEFSGGQRQRISIARALILEPEFLVLDEPTSALDVSVQAQVLNLLRELQAKRNLTYLFITHNLSVVEYIADVVAIMYLGRIVEYAPAGELFGGPRHPYTESLLKAVPSLGERKPFEPVVGDVPSPLNPPAGCHFHPRCPIYRNEPDGSPLRQKCRTEYPSPKTRGNAFVACHARE